MLHWLAMQPSKPVLVQLFILAVGAFLGVRTAVPCSLIAPSETAGPFGTTGAMPLLILERSASATLLGPNGTVPVEPADPDPRIRAARGGNGGPISFFAPRDPLPPGQYTFDDGRVQFTVMDPAIDSEPALSDGGTIALSISDGGGFGCAQSSCGDITALSIDVPGLTSGATYLIELETDDGDSLSRLVSERNGVGSHLLFYGEFPEIDDLDDVTICGKVTAVRTDGSLGRTSDLGCAQAE